MPPRLVTKRLQPDDLMGATPAQPGQDTVLQLPRASPLRPARRGFARSRWRIGPREPASSQDVIVMYSARSAMPGAD